MSADNASATRRRATGVAALLLLDHGNAPSERIAPVQAVLDRYAAGIRSDEPLTSAARRVPGLRCRDRYECAGALYRTEGALFDSLALFADTLVAGRDTLTLWRATVWAPDAGGAAGQVRGRLTALLGAPGAAFCQVPPPWDEGAPAYLAHRWELADHWAVELRLIPALPTVTPRHDALLLLSVVRDDTPDSLLAWRFHHGTGRAPAERSRTSR